MFGENDLNKSPWKYTFHKDAERLDHRYYNAVGEPDYYSIKSDNGNLICSLIGSEQDARMMTLTPELIKALLKLNLKKDPEIVEIISPIMKKLTAI